MTRPKAISYSRVSTGEQIISAEDQADRIRTYCQNLDYELVEELEDNGLTGRLYPQDRPGLSQAIRLIETGQAEILVCLDQTRLSRRMDICDFYTDLGRLGGSVEYLESPNPSMATATDRFVTRILAAESAYERDRLAERTAKALERLKKTGKRLGMPVSEESRKAGRLASELRESGLTLAKIADRLNQAGMTSARGKPFTVGIVKNVLRSFQLDREAESNRIEYQKGQG